MESIIMIGIIFFFGVVALSTIAQRNGPQPGPIFVIRAEPLEKLPVGDAGKSLVVLILVISAAIWIL